MRVLAALLAVAAAVVSAPVATAGDHETVGGGTFFVSNSNEPCTDFEAAGIMFNVCTGQSIAVPFTKYIVVPLGTAAWVNCTTLAPDGSIFERDDEYAYEIAENQQFWTSRGWGAYTPVAMCQMW